jgi:transposase-like protein
MISNELSSLWEQRLAEYETSGKSVVAWCIEQSVRKNQFYYWSKKLRQDQAAKDRPVKWLSLDPDHGKPASGATNSILVCVGQVTVEIKKGFDQHLLREIVQVLQTI